MQTGAQGGNVQVRVWFLCLFLTRPVPHTHRHTQKPSQPQSTWVQHRAVPAELCAQLGLWALSKTSLSPPRPLPAQLELTCAHPPAPRTAPSAQIPPSSKDVQGRAWTTQLPSSSPQPSRLPNEGGDPCMPNLLPKHLLREPGQGAAGRSVPRSDTHRGTVWHRVAPSQQLD